MNPELCFFNLSRRKPELNLTGERQLKIRHIPCDLSDRQQVEEACLSLTSELNQKGARGRILLINNSGFGTYGPFPEPNLDRNLEMLAVNVCAPVALTASLLPILRSEGGAVINISSTAAYQATAGMAVYGASKAFVLHWSLALSEELKGSGVRVLAVCPGPTSTSFFRNAGLERPIIPDLIGQTSDEVVMTSFQALALGRSVVVSGWKNKLGAFFSSKLPKVMAASLAAKVIARFRPTGKKSVHG